MTKAYAIAAVAGIAALLGGVAGYVLFAETGEGKYAECGEGQAIGASIGGPFTLVDQTGAKVTDKTVLKGPALVYFGYTFCPDVCPLDAQRNADAVDILAQKGLAVTSVFITIDPARDTPKVLADWTFAIDPKMIGLTGTPDEIKAVSTVYKTYYKQQPSSDDNYLMDHSIYTYLMLPDIGFAEFFDRDMPADKLAEKVGCFLNAS